MGIESALRTSITYHRGRIWFTTMEGDALYLLEKDLCSAIVNADKAIQFLLASEPKSSTFGPFVNATHTTLFIALYARDDKLALMPISTEWMERMKSMLAQTRALIRHQKDASFSLELDPQGEIVKREPDFHTLPPCAMEA